MYQFKYIKPPRTTYMCGGGEDDDSAGELWVACDLCDSWYHVMCTSIPPEDHNRLADVHWACENC